MGEIKAMEELQTWVAAFSAALGEKDIPKTMDLFGEECYWRDLLAFTWNIQTMESSDEMVLMLEENLQRVSPTNWEVTGSESKGLFNTIGVALKFETSVAWCRGFVWLKDSKCRYLMTTMWELKGHEEKVARFRPMGLTVGAIPGRKSWGERRNQEQDQFIQDKQPYCLIVGGGQAGVMLAARLRVLGVPTLIIEKNTRIGDSWHNRYRSLALHTPVFNDDFPYESYPSNWPLFPSKDQFGDWIEFYSKIMGLNYWCSADCKSASFDETAGHWKVEVEKKSEDGSSTIILHPTQLVIACGFTGHPSTPKIKGAESFEGDQFHSSQYKQGRDWRGRKAIVFGASTSAHDICLDLHEQGASEVTMIQRSASIVVRLTTFLETLANNERDSTPNFDLDFSDIMGASMPFKAQKTKWALLSKELDKKEAEFHKRLKEVGYKVHWGEDGGGIPSSLYQRSGGYYFNMGAAEAIASGGVKVKSGVQEIRARSVVFTDGSEREADLIVYATGYGNMRDHLDSLISKEVGEKVGLCWGLGSGTSYDPGPWEGELKNIWKPLAVPNLWVASSFISISRFFSRHLALQLKARMEGIPTPVFTLSRLVKTNQSH